MFSTDPFAALSRPPSNNNNPQQQNQTSVFPHGGGGRGGGGRGSPFSQSSASPAVIPSGGLSNGTSASPWTGPFSSRPTHNTPAAGATGSPFSKNIFQSNTSPPIISTQSGSAGFIASSNPFDKSAFPISFGGEAAATESGPNLYRKPNNFINNGPRFNDKSISSQSKSYPSTFTAPSPPQCRVCKKTFNSFQEMKQHVKAENHYDTSATSHQVEYSDDMAQSSSDYRTSKERLSSTSQSFSCKVCEQAFSSYPELKQHIKMEKHYRTNASMAAIQEAYPVEDFYEDDSPQPLDKQQLASKVTFKHHQQQQQPSTALYTSVEDDDGVKAEEQIQILRSKLLREKMKAQNSATSDNALSQDWRKSFNPSAQSSTKSAIKQKPTIISKVEHAFVPPSAKAASSAVSNLMRPHTSDSSHKSVGMCHDMCPKEERHRRVNESDVHRLEMLSEDVPGLPSSLRLTMIKKLQRSSADHELKIPHLMRTARVLTNTVHYIETMIMEKDLEGPDARFANEDPPEIDVYLFVWDRFRMIAKDFILQLDSNDANITSDSPDISSLTFLLRHDVQDDSIASISERVFVDKLCIECHERMCRWHIMMEHHMAHNEEFNSVHKQQNGEQLFRLLKSLDEFYFGSTAVSCRGKYGPPLNIAEFCCYYIIFQIDNGKEVALYIRGLPKDILESDSVKFAIQVWVARKTNNYALFFKLLYYAKYLQACCMYRYVGNMRLVALKTIARTYRAGKVEAYIPISELAENLMFEDDEDISEFFEHCGVEVVDDAEGICAVMVGQSVEDNLPVDKNGNPIPPRVRQLLLGIESKIQGYSRKDICRGVENDAILFALNCEQESNDDDDNNNDKYITKDDSGGPSGKSGPSSKSSQSSRKFPGARNLGGGQLGTSRPLSDDDDDDDDPLPELSSDEDEQVAPTATSDLMPNNKVSSPRDTSIAISDDDESDDDKEEKSNVIQNVTSYPCTNLDTILTGPPSLSRQSSVTKVTSFEAPSAIQRQVSGGKSSSFHFPPESPLPPADTANNPSSEKLMETIITQPFGTLPLHVESINTGLDSGAFDMSFTSTSIKPLQRQESFHISEQPSRVIAVPNLNVEKQMADARIRQLEIDKIEKDRQTHLLRENAQNEFMLKHQIKHKRKSLQHSFRSWIIATKVSLTLNDTIKKRLFLSIWKRIYYFHVRQRSSFTSCIRSINMAYSMNENAQHTQVSRQISHRTNMIVEFPVTCAPVPLIYWSRSNVDLNLSIPQIAGPVLQSKYNGIMQKLSAAGQCKASAWHGKLFWKCAIVSSAATCGMITDSDSAFSKYLRCVFNNCDNQDTYRNGIIGYWDITVSAYNPLHMKNEVNQLAICVIDVASSSSLGICNNEGANNVILIVEVDSNGQFSHKSLQNFTDNQIALTCPQISLILVSDSLQGSSQCEFKFVEINLEESSTSLYLIITCIMEYLTNSTNSDIELLCAYSVQCSDNDAFIHSSSQFQEFINLLLSSSIQSSPTFPFVVKHNIAFDIGNQINEAIWDAAPNRKEPDNFNVEEFRYTIRYINWIIDLSVFNMEQTIDAFSKLELKYFAPEFRDDKGYIRSGTFDENIKEFESPALPQYWFDQNQIISAVKNLRLIKLRYSESLQLQDFVDTLEGFGSRIPSRLVIHFPFMAQSGKWRRALSIIISALLRDLDESCGCVYLLHKSHFRGTIVDPPILRSSCSKLIHPVGRNNHRKNSRGPAKSSLDESSKRIKVDSEFLKLNYEENCRQDASVVSIPPAFEFLSLISQERKLIIQQELSLSNYMGSESMLDSPQKVAKFLNLGKLDKESLRVYLNNCKLERENFDQNALARGGQLFN